MEITYSNNFIKTWNPQPLKSIEEPSYTPEYTPNEIPSQWEKKSMEQIAKEIEEYDQLCLREYKRYYEELKRWSGF